MGSWAVRSVVAVAALLLAIGLAPGPSAAHPSGLPVTYDFLDGIAAELSNPGGSLPGTNDFTCRPGPEHPHPVILLHGAGGGRQTNWATLAPVLKNAGYCVFALTYGALSPVWPASALGGLGVKIDGAWQVKAFIDRVLATTEARQVDIVAHSLGTEMGIYWMKYLGGRGKVGAYVSLAPYWRQGPDGDDVRSDAIAAFRTRLAIPAPPRPTCRDCASPPADLDFNRAVREPTPYLPGVRYTNIVTRYDEIVTPYTVGLLDGPDGTTVRNIVTQVGCRADRSDHMSITSNRRSAAMVLNALGPAYPRRVPCVPVPPFTGG